MIYLNKKAYLRTVEEILHSVVRIDHIYTDYEYNEEGCNDIDYTMEDYYKVINKDDIMRYLSSVVNFKYELEKDLDLTQKFINSIIVKLVISKNQSTGLHSSEKSDCRLGNIVDIELKSFIVSEQTLLIANDYEDLIVELKEKYKKSISSEVNATLSIISKIMKVLLDDSEIKFKKCLKDMINNDIILKLYHLYKSENIDYLNTIFEEDFSQEIFDFCHKYYSKEDLANDLIPF